MNDSGSGRENGYYIQENNRMRIVYSKNMKESLANHTITDVEAWLEIQVGKRDT